MFKRGWTVNYRLPEEGLLLAIGVLHVLRRCDIEDYCVSKEWWPVNPLNT